VVAGVERIIYSMQALRFTPLQTEYTRTGSMIPAVPAMTTVLLSNQMYGMFLKVKELGLDRPLRVGFRHVRE
jgi:hypothetical protein